MGERKPRIVYLPLRCSVKGCVRSPYVTVDGIPYCTASHTSPKASLMGEYSAERPAVSIGSKAEGYACPKDGTALTIIDATPTRAAGAWCPECHTVWREVGEVSLEDLDDLPETRGGEVTDGK